MDKLTPIIRLTLIFQVLFFKVCGCSREVFLESFIVIIFFFCFVLISEFLSVSTFHGYENDMDCRIRLKILYFYFILGLCMWFG